MKCKIKLLTETAKIPSKKYDSDNCYDVYADEDKTLFPHGTEKIKTGISLQPAAGYGFVVRERSGVSLKGIAVLGGEIDNKFTGEISVIMLNGSSNIYNVKKGDRIAQIRPIKIECVEWNEVEVFDETKRGVNGFGSTGR